MYRCVNVLPTVLGQEPVQCDMPAEHPNAFCDVCAMVTAHMAMDGARIIDHHDFPMARCPNGHIMTGRLYVAESIGEGLMEKLLG